MIYYKINNWKKFQHYKDRNPPWIKLHQSMLDDEKFMCLQDDSKLQLIMLFLLAARVDNKICGDEKFLRNRLGIENVNLEPLISSGFLSVYDTASNVIADCVQDACVETETEAYKEETEAEAETTYANGEIFLKFTTKGKNSSWNLSTEQFDLFKDNYLGLDVESELKHAAAWCESNPAKRKTPRGMMLFLKNWMNNAVKNKASKKPSAYDERLGSNESLENKANCGELGDPADLPPDYWDKAVKKAKEAL